MQKKIFESHVGMGFRFYYPFLLTGLIIISLLVNFIFLHSENLYYNNIGKLLMIAFVIDLVIINFFQKTRKIKVTSIAENIYIKIYEGSSIVIDGQCDIIDNWWSYFNLKDIGDSNIRDEDEINHPKRTSSKLKGFGPTMARMLFIEFKCNEEIFYLHQMLEEYQELPSNWNYKLLSEDIYNSGYESYKLDILINQLNKIETAQNQK